MGAIDLVSVSEKTLLLPLESVRFVRPFDREEVKEAKILLIGSFKIILSTKASVTFICDCGIKVNKKKLIYIILRLIIEI